MAGIEVPIVLLGAVALGLVHGAEPGHGWPIAAAYALRRPNKWRSGFVASTLLGLGHLVSSLAVVGVFFLADAYLELSRLDQPLSVFGYPIGGPLGVIAGVLLVFLGVWEYRRGHEHGNSTGGDHDHGSDRVRHHDHARTHVQRHSTHGQSHSQDHDHGRGHSHGRHPDDGHAHDAGHHHDAIYRDDASPDHESSEAGGVGRIGSGPGRNGRGGIGRVDSGRVGSGRIDSGRGGTGSPSREHPGHDHFDVDDPDALGLAGIVWTAFVLGFVHEEEFEIVGLCLGSGSCLELMVAYALAVLAGLVGLTMLLIAGYYRFEERIEGLAEHFPAISGVVLVSMGFGFVLGII